MEWIKIENRPAVGMYVTKSEQGWKNNLYYAPNGEWYHSEWLYEQYPDKKIDGIVEWLDEEAPTALSDLVCFLIRTKEHACKRKTESKDDSLDQKYYSGQELICSMALGYIDNPAPPVSLWVDVLDKLPEDMQQVIAAKHNGVVMEMRYQGGIFQWYQGNNKWLAQTPQVTHWMPLPSAPLA